MSVTSQIVINLLKLWSKLTEVWLNTSNSLGLWLTENIYAAKISVKAFKMLWVLSIPFLFANLSTIMMSSVHSLYKSINKAVLWKQEVFGILIKFYS